MVTTKKKIKVVPSKKEEQKKEWGETGRDLLTVSYGERYSTLIFMHLYF